VTEADRIVRDKGSNDAVPIGRRIQQGPAWVDRILLTPSRAERGVEYKSPA
jgi:hypothetical protein